MVFGVKYKYQMLYVQNKYGEDGLHLVGVARKRATINIYLTNKVVGPSGIFEFIVYDVYLSWLCMTFF